jgi:ATPase subunit of ABC transporter with duplicated ATPase domains
MPFKDPEAKKAYQKAYAQRNREKAYEKIKEWRAANPEKWAEQSKRYAKKYPEKSVARTQAWKARNPEKAVEVDKRTRQKNSARVTANRAKYRAVKLQATPVWLNKAHWFEMSCVYVYRDALKRVGLNYQVDHIVPLRGKNVSGLHVPENLQVILATQNRLKNNCYAE